MIKLTKEDLLEIIQQFSLEGLNRLSLKTDNFKLEVEKESEKEFLSVESPSITAQTKTASPEKEVETENYKVESPMVGVFYEAQEPGAKPYVSVGDSVEEGDTLYIIEAMKMIHEISSPISGTVEKILVKDGEVVEYSQRIMEIKEC